MNKYFHIAFLLVIPLTALNQQSTGRKQKVWKEERDLLEYRREKGYKGPEEWYGGTPSTIKEKEEDPYGYVSPASQSNQGIQYNPQRIQRDRQRQYGGYDRGGGQGTLKFDPKVKKPDPITWPDVEPPDIDAPDVPDVEPPLISPAVWRVILYILVIAIVVIILYFWLKNRGNKDRAVAVDIQNDWNPEYITKTELELRLEEAMAQNDYRECVRIYFTFILKELIRKQWIYWKREKTNHHYVLEMGGKPGANGFEECVRIYDLVWYGEYGIGKDEFEKLQPVLLNYYRSLEPKDE